MAPGQEPKKRGGPTGCGHGQGREWTGELQVQWNMDTLLLFLYLRYLSVATYLPLPRYTRTGPGVVGTTSTLGRLCVRIATAKIGHIHCNAFIHGCQVCV